MTTTGEKLTLLAEIIRVAVKGATDGEISDELSLSVKQTGTYVRFLKAKKLLVHLDNHEYFPSERGLAFLATYDEAADLADVDSPSGSYSGSKPSSPNKGVYWDKSEIAARMREIIEK